MDSQIPVKFLFSMSFLWHQPINNSYKFPFICTEYLHIVNIDKWSRFSGIEKGKGNGIENEWHFSFFKQRQCQGRVIVACLSHKLCYKNVYTDKIPFILVPFKIHTTTIRIKCDPNEFCSPSDGKRMKRGLTFYQQVNFCIYRHFTTTAITFPQLCMQGSFNSHWQFVHL